MDLAGISMFVFGIYIIIIGTGFLVMPNVILPIFKFEKTNEVWIRIMGLIVAILGYYYINATVHDLTVFYWSTVWGRFVILVGFTLLVVLKKAKPMLVLFGLVDSAGAVWNYYLCSWRRRKVSFHGVVLRITYRVLSEIEETKRESILLS